jgi:modification methylase
LWTQKVKGAPYTFNYQVMKSLNDDLQMRSDWVLPLCTGEERLKVDGVKAHSTQKPEALLYRIIASSSNPGDVVLDPFFGTGTTGAVAKKLHRRWVGIERDETYIQLAQARINAVQPPPYVEKIFQFPDKRKLPRVPFGVLLEQGLLKPGQRLYFKEKPDKTALILANGKLKYNDFVGSIHQVAKLIADGPCNGWDHWYYMDEQTGQKMVINNLRDVIRQQGISTPQLKKVA